MDKAAFSVSLSLLGGFDGELIAFDGIDHDDDGVLMKQRSQFFERAAHLASNENLLSSSGWRDSSTWKQKTWADEPSSAAGLQRVRQ